MSSVLQPLEPAKFRDPDVTAMGEPRAQVSLKVLKTLWFNTGTLCNVTCANCYIGSSPTNDRLAYLTSTEVAAFLDEFDALAGRPGEAREIGFTGGEPFMNPEIILMLDDCLRRGYRVLILTNAMRPMMKLEAPLLDLKDQYGGRLTIRVSLDHYTRELHETERGKHSWEPVLKGLGWLAHNGFTIFVAGRTRWGQDETELRAGYARLFAPEGITIDANNPAQLVLFPEMDDRVDIPEITEACWGVLNVDPDDMMCATSRMVIKRKGADRPVVVPCTLLPYDPQFEFGHTLAKAEGGVKLNHPHCAKFCVLGGGSCGSGS
jgi:uncharacterized Fe-S cluster-containing radical SAM superfamily protein